MRYCEKCNEPFSTKMMVDGKQRNLQNRRYCLDCSPFKCHNTRPILIGPPVKKRCKECGKEMKSNRRNVCDSCSVRKVQRRKKQRAINFYGGKCIKCGYDKCQGVLQFHHRDPSTKRELPSYVVLRWSWDRAKKELDKCDLLCANCHGELHWLLDGL